MLTFAYYFIAFSRKPDLYNRRVILAVEIFGVGLWLVSFVLLTRWASSHLDGDGQSDNFWRAPFQPSDVGLERRSGIIKRSTNKRHVVVAFAGTAAGLGGAEL